MNNKKPFEFKELGDIARGAAMHSGPPQSKVWLGPELLIEGLRAVTAGLKKSADPRSAFLAAILCSTTWGCHNQ